MKLTRIILIGVLLIGALGAKTCALAAQNGEKTTVRVGISNQNFSNYEHASAKFSSPDEMSVTDMSSNSKITVDGAKVIEVSIEEDKFKIISQDEVLLEEVKGPLVLASKEKIGIVDLNRKGTPAYYREMIELVPSGAGKFNIVNVLNEQTYIKGVVPNEMPVSFGYEALKAQAIAARNYVNRPSGAYKNYDICDSTACQVYYGANSQTQLSDRAVDETRGIFALYDKEPILALYHSTSGGITEDWKNVYALGQNVLNKPYLSSVSDNPNYKTLTSEADVRKFYSDKIITYDIKSPRYRWKTEWTGEELEEVLNKTLQEQSRAGLVEPKYDGSEKLTGLKDIKVLSRGKSGKALEIEITFKNGTYKVKRELGIRRVLKKNGSMLSSGNFFIDIVEKTAEVQQQEPVTEPKSESIFSFERFLSSPKTQKETVIEKITITGGGFGHGVGMSQHGAGYLAQNGKKYSEILKHYYTGIKLGTMQKEVFYNPWGVKYKTDFYFDKNLNKTAVLNVYNPKRAGDVSFYVNSNNFESNLKKYCASALRFDITKYMQQGLNSVVFMPLGEWDKGKTIKYQIEIGN